MMRTRDSASCEGIASARDPLYAALRELFGFSAFRPYQEEIIRAIMEQRDAFVVMPTGGGKSLCYQLPAHLMPGVCLVISPLISLMKDQVDAAKASGLRADFLNSSQTGKARAEVAARLAEGQLDLLYASPERFAMPDFKAALDAVPLSFVAIDEAHCISEWGHDFRPDYLNLAEIVERFPRTPIAAFTATATLKVQQDIINKLGLRRPFRVRASFNRPNLYYRVLHKTDAEGQILKFIRSHAGEQGIVYRTTRKDVESTASLLASHGIKALPYHAGMDDGARTLHQEAFNRDEVEVIVATIAFGMGIDKSNVRFVVHGDLPKNIEGYYQETGRAGRDGEPAQCLLLFGRGDIGRIRYFIDQVTDEEARSHALHCMNDMVRYGSTHGCRRRHLLAYFGETYGEPDCGMCDVCAGTVEKMDATRDAQIALSAIVRTGGRFGIRHIIDVLTGANTRKIRDLAHDQIKTFGAGRDKAKQHWRSVIEHLLAQGYAHQTTDRYPVIRPAERARSVLHGDARVSILKPVEPVTTRRARGAYIACNEALFTELRMVRKRVADEQGVPPFVILSDRSLREMAARYPVTPAAMGLIQGVGAHKLKRYGALFAEAVQSFLERNPEVEPDPHSSEVEGSRPLRRNPSCHLTGELLDQGLPVSEIAARRGLAAGTIAGHIEQLMEAGHPVDIDRLMEPDRRRQIEDLFEGTSSPQLKDIVDRSEDGAVSYAEARLVRAWLANCTG